MTRVPTDLLEEHARRISDRFPDPNAPGALDGLEEATERLIRWLDAQGYEFTCAEVQDAISAA